MFNIVCYVFFFFFFKQKTAYEIRKGDWSSDVCSSDLVSDQTQQVERAAATPHLAAQLRHRRQPEERTRLYRLGDAHDFLGHDAPGPEIQVTHFAVADLSLGQAHRESGRVEQRARRSRPETMPGGCVPQLDVVPLPAGTEPPAVEHDEDDRGARPMPLCHIGGDAI